MRRHHEINKAQMYHQKRKMRRCPEQREGGDGENEQCNHQGKPKEKGRIKVVDFNTIRSLVEAIGDIPIDRFEMNGRITTGIIGATGNHGMLMSGNITGMCIMRLRKM